MTCLRRATWQSERTSASAGRPCLRARCGRKYNSMWSADNLPETWIAILLDSKVLGKPIWVARHRNFVSPDGNVVYYLSEMANLKGKTAEELKKIQLVKETFKGGEVKRQGKLL